MTIRVVIADDHRVVRDGLCYLLSQEPDVEVAGEAGDGRQAVDVVAATRPDVLLLDLYMPGLGEQTVKTHVSSILTKLGLQDRVQAAIFALRHQADSCEHRP